jgi:hypothetical protein
LLWQRTLGADAIPAGSGADGDSSGAVDGPDLDLWSDNFGPPSSSAAWLADAAGVASLSPLATRDSRLAVADAAFALLADANALLADADDSRPSFRPLGRRLLRRVL